MSATLHISSPFRRKVTRPESGYLFQMRRQHTFDAFHECADSARQIAPMCYDEGHSERPATEIGHNLHQRSAVSAGVCDSLSAGPDWSCSYVATWIRRLRRGSRTRAVTHERSKPCMK